MVSKNSKTPAPDKSNNNNSTQNGSDQIAPQTDVIDNSEESSTQLSTANVSPSQNMMQQSYE